MIVRNATLADGRRRDVRVDPNSGTVAAVGRQVSGAGEEIDATGKLLLPGAIDAHVHFREPGFSHKETWATGSKSAAAGGVTTVVDQPNTDPPTVDGASFDGKTDLAAESLVDYGLNGGVTPDWDPDELLSRPLFALGEVFLADSTGEMGIEEDLFREAVELARGMDVPVTVHAEDATLFDERVLARSTECARGDEPRANGREEGPTDADAWSAYRRPVAEVAAIERVCAVGTDLGTRLHVAHASTPGGIDAAKRAGMTCEVCPHHMLLSRDDYDDLGTFGRMNPPLRTEERRRQVAERVADGTVDLVATDHAPHTRAEKDASIWDAPSGVPGVETMLPLLLEQARQGPLSYRRVQDLTASNPARIFDLPRKGRIEAGRDADLVLVDPDATREIRGSDLHTKCGWTPFEGWSGVFPEWTMVRGRFVYRDGEFGEPMGENVRTIE
jgi:dihydroorotase